MAKKKKEVKEEIIETVEATELVDPFYSEEPTDKKGRYSKRGWRKIG